MLGHLIGNLLPWLAVLPMRAWNMRKLTVWIAAFGKLNFFIARLRILTAFLLLFSDSWLTLTGKRLLQGNLQTNSYPIYWFFNMKIMAHRHCGHNHLSARLGSCCYHHYHPQIGAIVSDIHWSGFHSY